MKQHFKVNTNNRGVCGGHKIAPRSDITTLDFLLWGNVKDYITVACTLNKLTHSKRPVCTYIGFTQIAAQGGKRYVICGK
jgi:hypothetical protein